MKVTKIQIKNLFGLKELTLNGKSVELAGKKGSGKTSALDAIRLNLTNRSDRDYIIRQGANEGEILIETDTGLSIDRRIRTEKADSIKVRDGNVTQTRPAEFLNGIFTPLQLNPVEFAQMSRQDKNRVILSLIQFPWDMNWIKQQFGEIPQGVDYSKHILEVLYDIQADNGVYYQSRQNVNRDIRNKQSYIEDIGKTLPDGYDAEKWDKYPLSEKYREAAEIKENNSRIERAKTFMEGMDGKKRGIKADYETELAAAKNEMASRRETLTGSIERMKAEIAAAEKEIAGLEKEYQNREKTARAQMDAATAKLEKDAGVGAEYAGRKLTDVSSIQGEIDTAEEMRKYLNECRRREAMQKEVAEMRNVAEEYTRKIELARELPSEILATAKMPIDGLTVENGIPLVNGLPVSNLSDGETLSLCVQIAAAKPGALGIILIDGCERLDEKSRQELYAQCKTAGLQIIATRTTNADELEVIEL